MYSDLFDQLGAGGGGAGARGGRGGDTTSRGPAQTPPLVSCKAGKMVLTPQGEGDKFQCTPDPARGELRLVYQEQALQWQWYNRREQTVVDKVLLPVSDGPAGTFRRVPLAGKKHEGDRVYVWTRTVGQSQVKHEMYWMQDASEEKEDETVAQINQYLADPASAAPATSESAATGAAAASGGGATSGGSGNANQVDALSTILENLGMPQQPSEGSGGSGAAGAEGGATAAGTLTLADLQGAMAGMQQQQAAAQPVPLSEVVTPAAITQLVEHMDDATRQRLVELLPEGQRTPEQLEENLRSPQVQQTLRSLTQALLPDDTGNMDGFYSVLANFQLEAPQDPTVALTNPIGAFLDAVLASVQNDEQGGGEESKQDEEGDGDAEMKDGEEQGDGNDEGKQDG